MWAPRLTTLTTELCPGEESGREMPGHLGARKRQSQSGADSRLPALMSGAGVEMNPVEDSS